MAFLGWTIKYEPAAVRDLKKLSRDDAARITRFVSDTLATSQDPREYGERLTGYPAWKFRMGTYRLIGLVSDDHAELRIWIVQHRREVYQALRRRLKPG